MDVAFSVWRNEESDVVPGLRQGEGSNLFQGLEHTRQADRHGGIVEGGRPVLTPEVARSEHSEHAEQGRPEHQREDGPGQDTCQEAAWVDQARSTHRGFEHGTHHKHHFVTSGSRLTVDPHPPQGFHKLGRSAAIGS